MNNNNNNIINNIVKIGATKVAIINPDEIVFSPELRPMCEMNTCGKYNACWTCPPGVGEVLELEKKIKAYKEGFVVQFVYQLEDSFDFEGMMEGQKQFKQMFEKAIKEVKKGDFQALLPLTAGGCELCEQCTYPDSECRHPNDAKPSIEACGIYVNKTIEKVGMDYYNGENTVSYVGIIMIK